MLCSTLVVYDCENNTGFQVICWTSSGIGAFDSTFIKEIGAWPALANTPDIACVSTRPTALESASVNSSSGGISRGMLDAALGVPLALLCALIVGAYIWYRRSLQRRDLENVTEVLETSAAGSGSGAKLAGAYLLLVLSVSLQCYSASLQIGVIGVCQDAFWRRVDNCRNQHDSWLFLGRGSVSSPFWRRVDSCRNQQDSRLYLGRGSVSSPDPQSQQVC